MLYANHLHALCKPFTCFVQINTHLLDYFIRSKSIGWYSKFGSLWEIKPEVCLGSNHPEPPLCSYDINPAPMRQLCSHEYPVRLPFLWTGDIVSVWHSLEGEEYEETPKSSSNSVLAQNWTVLVSRRVARLHQSAINQMKFKELYEYEVSIGQKILEHFEQNLCFILTGLPLRIRGDMLSLRISDQRFLLQLPSINYIYNHLLNSSYGGVL
jgi:hypothetical protein